MKNRRVVKMVEMFESPYSITIYGSDSSHSRISEDEVEDQILSSPTPLLEPPSADLLEPAPKTPSSPTYNSMYKRKHTASNTPVPISQMTVDVDETKLDKLFKILNIVKEFIFFPFLYTTRGIEVS